MSRTLPDDSALTKLEEALASGALPVHARKAGRRLLDRLQSPVSCIILGPQNSGKSKLLNLLAGMAIVPDSARFPILELAWAETSRTTFTKHDGTTVVLDGVVLDAPSVEAVTSVKIEADLPVLKRLGLIEVGLSGSATEQSATVDWAIGQADMVLWCTQEFSPQEQELWARVPDALKDHGFLVLTKADVLMAQGILTQRLQSVQDVAADEFHSVFPIATLQAIDAKDKDATAGASALAASGGKALIAAVLRQVEQGRGADMDGILVFLARHGPKAPRKPKVAGATPPVHGANETTASAPDNDVAANAPSTAELASAALDYLKGRASGLGKISPDPSALNPKDVLNHCGETANGLADIVADQVTSDPVLVELQENLLDAAELLLLMEMENGVSPAADAVTVLLQVRRGLEYRLAA